MEKRKRVLTVANSAEEKEIQMNSAGAFSTLVLYIERQFLLL